MSLSCPDEEILFDRLLERELAGLPASIRQRLEQIPVIVDNEPETWIWDQMQLDSQQVELCGLHTGIPLTQRSPMLSSRLPDQIRLFRGPIFRVVQARGGGLARQIHITLLHKIGHHFGLTETQLRQLGYD